MHTRVLDTEQVLMALLPPLGPRAALGPWRAHLKWAGTEPLRVAQSVLEFVGADGRLLGRYREAFGLGRGVLLQAPCSKRLADEHHLPPDALVQRWTVNEWTVTAPVAESQAVWNSLCVTCLPLQVSLPDDDHIVVGIVNTSEGLLNISQSVRDAVCWVDGKAFASVTGHVWNGPYLVRPGHATMRRFRLADFPGAPVQGDHELVFEMAGRRSAPQRVRWHGIPWTK